MYIYQISYILNILNIYIYIYTYIYIYRCTIRYDMMRHATARYDAMQYKAGVLSSPEVFRDFEASENTITFSTLNLSTVNLSFTSTLSHHN